MYHSAAGISERAQTWKPIVTEARGSTAHILNAYSKIRAPTPIILIYLISLNHFRSNGVKNSLLLTVVFSTAILASRTCNHWELGLNSRHGNELRPVLPPLKSSADFPSKMLCSLWLVTAEFYQTFLSITFYQNNFLWKFFLCLNIRFILGPIVWTIMYPSS